MYELHKNDRKNGVIRHLEKLGFEGGTARIKPLGRNSDHGLISYDSLIDGEKRPYLTVVYGRDSSPSLFLDLPSPEDKSEYVAFTDGSQWSWYRKANDTPLFRHTCPSPCKQYQISPTVLWSCATETCSSGSTQCARPPFPPSRSTNNRISLIRA